MSRGHTRNAKPGVLPKGLAPFDMFQTDVVNGVLYLDHRCGLGLMSQATQLMDLRTRRPYAIQRVSAVELQRVKTRVKRRVRGRRERQAA